MLTADSHGPPKALTSLALTNCTGSGMDSFGMQHMFQALKHQLTHLEVRDLAALGAGDLNQVLVDLPCLTHLVIDSNYMDQDFGKQAAYAGGMLPNSCPRVRPLKSLTITCSSHYASDNAFTAIDLFTLIDDRVLGRLRTVRLQRMFKDFNDEEDIEGVEQALLQLDEENWNERNYQYAQFKDMYKELSWSDWIETPLGSEMAPIFEIFGGGLRRERNGNGVGGGYSMN